MFTYLGTFLFYFNSIFVYTVFLFYDFLVFSTTALGIIFFNFKLFPIFEAFYNYLGFKISTNLIILTQPNNDLTYGSNYFNNLSTGFQNKYNSEELSINVRYQRFNNPLFKYDFKSGDYFPKLYKEIYTYLFSTILETTSDIRTSP